MVVLGHLHAALPLACRRPALSIGPCVAASGRAQCCRRTVFRQGGVGAGTGVAGPAIAGTGTVARMILVRQVQIPG
jgi:hypothetical protein